MTEDLKQLVIDLYRARRDHRKAKAHMAAKAAEFGSCDGLDFDEMMRPHGCPCYEDPEIMGDRSEWCEACQGRQPSYEAYKRLGHEKGRILQAILRIGQKLSDVEEAK